MAITVQNNIMTVPVEIPKCDLAFLRKLAANMGWTLPKRARKSGIEKAMDDVAAGRVTKYDSVDDFFKEMGI